VLVLASRRDGEDPDDRRDHADRSDEQREHHADDRALRGPGERRGAEDQRRDQRDLVGLEQVGRHARAVADVVADVVRDRRGVSRVVLGNALLHLADQVGADVRGLGEDAAAHPHEHREQRAAEPEADQHAGRVLLEDQQDHGRAEQAEADREHPRDAAGAERDPKRPPHPRLAGGVGYSNVRAHGEPHPRETGGRREPGAEHERDRPPEPDHEIAVHGVRRDRQGEEQRDGEQTEEHPDGSELPLQVRAGAHLDRSGDLAHRLGPLRRAEHLADEVVREHQRDERDAEDHP
jgi:hypothetical protein